MIQKIKYSQIFLAFWLQLWLFFTLIPSAFTGQLFSIGYVLGQLLYFGMIGMYVYSFYNQTTEPKTQRKYEWFALGLSWVLAAVYAAIIYSDPWLWQTSEFIGYDFILLLIWITVLLGASTVALCYHLFPKFSLDSNDKRLWNTYKTADLLFLALFSISIIFLTITNTKLVVGLMRDYWQMVRSLSTIVILFMLWYYGRYFVTQRQMFMAALRGYFLFLTVESILFLTVKAPLTRETLITIGEKNNGVDLAIIAMILHWLVMVAWLVWLYICEKKAAKKEK